MRSHAEEGLGSHLSVALSVLEQPQDELARLGRPAGLAVSRTLVLGLRGATDATAEAAEGDRALVLQHVLQVLLGGLERALLEGERCFACVFEVHAQVRPACLARLGAVLRLTRVLDLPKPYLRSAEEIAARLPHTADDARDPSPQRILRHPIVAL